MDTEDDITAAWCREISPGLAVFNKAFIRRAGAGLFPYVLLDGNKEAVDYCVKKEAQLFYNEGLYETDKVHTDIHKSDRGVFLVERFNENEKNVYLSLSHNGSLIFFGGGNPDHSNRYDVSGCDVVSFKEAFVPVIGMECDNAIIENILKKYPGIWNMDMDEIANNTTLCHYGHSDDDTLKEEDFSWLSGNTDLPAEDGSVSDSQPVLSAAEPGTQKSTEPEDKTGSDEQQSAPETGTGRETKDEASDPNNTPSAASAAVADNEENRHGPSEKGTDGSNAAEEQSAGPEKEKTDRAPGFTNEEREHNSRLLEAITDEYNNVLKLIDQENVPGMFSPVKRIINESLETTNFEESPIKKYIEISKDFSTELYKRLYESTEPLRQKFNSDVKRDIRHLTCYNCSSKWNADATFVKKDYGESKCPKCGTLIRFEMD